MQTRLLSNGEYATDGFALSFHLIAIAPLSDAIKQGKEIRKPSQDTLDLLLTAQFVYSVRKALIENNFTSAFQKILRQESKLKKLVKCPWDEIKNVQLYLENQV